MRRFMKKALDADVLQLILIDYSQLFTVGTVQKVCKRWYVCVAETYKTRKKNLEQKWLTQYPFRKGINMYRLTNGKTVFRIEPSVEMCMPVRILHSAFQCAFCTKWHVFKYSLYYKCPETKKRGKMPKPFLRTKKIFQETQNTTAIILNGLQRRHMSHTCPHRHIKKKMRTATESLISTCLL